MVKGKGFSAATRNKHLRQCKTIFNVAVEWGYLLTNPFSRIKQQKAAPKAWHYLKPSEFQRILAVVNDLRWRVFYYLVYTTGARVGELFNLTWSDVDLKRGIITIHSRRASEQLPPFQVKDHETRTLPIPIQTIEALKAWRKAASAEIPFVLLTATRWERVCAMWALCRKGEPWHMDGKTGQKVWTEWDSRFMVNNVLRNVRTHVRRAEIRLGAAMTVHSLRKSFAQNHADHGTPSATLKDLMGHASTQWRG
ncbi:MAG: site-specific integrase [Phycisphaerae bacterium]|nr:site-specific integrase [Phycisphaerae bacterium]